jgi:hypothetical protein
MLTDGADSARAYWFDEPGEYRWIFKRRGSTVRARILNYEDEGPPLRFLEAVTGRRLIDRVCSFRELVSALRERGRSWMSMASRSTAIGGSDTRSPKTISQRSSAL